MPAAIDVGTNTVRLLLGEVRDGIPVPMAYHRRITRLGGGFSQEKGLAPEAMERTLCALREFADLIRQAGAAPMRAVGTAALRKAGNAEPFLARVQDTTGLQIEILDGAEEARLSAVGVLAALAPRPAASLVFDIGGGSTEFILVEGDQARFRQSFDLGAVRLSESLFEPTAQGRWIGECLECLDASMRSAGVALGPDGLLVGTAGTVTTLAAMDLQMVEYDWRRINNHCISRTRLEQLHQVLEPLSAAEREQLPGMEKGRGDLILPGLRIVLAIMDRFGRRDLIVSDFGLLEGVLLSLHQAGK